MRPRLLIPGPTELEDEVLQVLSRQIVPHYGDEWVATFNATLAQLRRVFCTEQTVLLMVSTGTLAVESAMAGLVLAGEKMLVVNNGLFGERLVKISRALGHDVVELRAPDGDVPDLDDLRRLLVQQRPQAVTVVHNETSTGAVMPLQDTAAICNEAEVPLIVDGVSSIGGVAFRMDDWGIAACGTSTQKCLGAPPGLAPIAVSNRAIEIMEAKRERSHRGFYLDFLTWRDAAREGADWHPFPVSMACSLVLALQEALRLLFQEGLQPRLERYQATAVRLRAALRALGCEPLAREEVASPVTTTFLLPEGISAPVVGRQLREQRGLWVARGLGDWYERALRIGHFCRGASLDYLRLLILALSDILQAQGRPTDREAALAALGHR